MKKLFISILFLVIFKVTAQSGGGNEDLKLPNYISPTPEAEKFITYGNTPLNESTGNINLSIPLLNYKLGFLEIPISMSYTGTKGVNVNDYGSWTGVNWILNAGGMITRTVKDYPDEKASHREVKPYQQNEVYLNTNAGSQTNEFIYNNYLSNTVDTEADIYSFNFLGKSGSFYLDHNMAPRLMDYNEELKIEILPVHLQNGISMYDNRTIRITTIEGVEFYFGGLNASELTSSKVASGGSNIGSVLAQTGFHLYKIKHYNGDEIYLNYIDDYGSTERKMGMNQSFEDDLSFCNSCPSGLFGFRSSTSYLYGRAKLLSIISNNRNDDKLEFNVTVNSNVRINRYYLTELKLLENNTNLITRYTFQYLFPNQSNSERFFLEKIIKKSLQNQDLVHEFQYNQPHLLPEKFSFSQDHLGYYNGELNTNLLHVNQDDYFRNKYPNQNFANRNPSLNHALYGSLQKVTYPTGGYTLFDYELGYERSIVPYSNNFINVYFRNPDTNYSSKLLQDYYPDGGDGLYVVTQTQKIKIDINLSIFRSMTNQNQFVLKTYRKDSRGVFSVFNTRTISLTNTENATLNKYESFEIDLLPGQYYFKNQLSIQNITNSTNNNNTVLVNINFKLKNGLPIAIYKPGLRIKIIKDFANSNADPIVRKVYYNKYVNRNNLIDSELNYRIPSYNYNSMYEYVPNTGGPALVSRGNNKKGVSSSFIYNLNISTFSGVKYQWVTVANGENFELGYVESRFLLDGDQSQYDSYNYYPDLTNLSVNYSNNGIRDGQLLEKYIYKNNNGSFSLRMEEKYEYDVNINKTSFITNYNFYKAFSYVATGNDPVPGYSIYNYIISRYEFYSKNVNLKRKISKEYFGNDFIENISEYTYSPSYAGSISNVKTYNSSGDVIEKVYKYTFDINTPAHNEMIVNNRISDVVEETTYINNIKSFQKYNQYEFTDNTVNNYPKVSKIKTGKFQGVNGGLEDRIIFDLYDLVGNVNQLQQESGIPITYIWGYNETQPIAKIENATYAEVQQYEANLQTLSNGSNEANLLTALDNLRTALPNAMVTTYTYKPLVGISTITDPKGYKTTYHYDAFNRLEFVKDQDGNILSENEYHYRN